MSIASTGEYKNIQKPVVTYKFASEMEELSDFIYLAETKEEFIESIKTSLEKGMPESEIKMMLEGEFDGLSEDEAPAIFYVQHRADKNGIPSSEAQERLVEFYGDTEDKRVLGADTLWAL